MEEKHEIITPNFISKAASTTASLPSHPSYKHIAAQVTINRIHLTIFKGVNPKLAGEIVQA